MKKGLAIATALLLVGALGLYFRPSKPPPDAVAAAPPASFASTQVAKASAPSNASAPIALQAIVQQPAPQAGQLVIDSGPPAELPPEIALRNVERAVHEYGDMFNGNPVGTNPEITSQLNGNNPKRVHFIDSQAGMKINGNGELVDAWGTPYFFHQISGSETEIHSAGPDKLMWTSDDLVAK